MLTLRLVGVGFLLVMSMLVFPPVTTAQGNSEAKEACQHGGYLDLMDAEGRPFKNAGQCMAHAAQGGTLFAPDLSIDGGAISGTGFTPNSELVVLERRYSSGLVEDNLPLDPTIDATGAFSFSGYCAIKDDTSVEITATDAAGISRIESFDITGYTEIHCPV